MATATLHVGQSGEAFTINLIESVDPPGWLIAGGSTFSFEKAPDDDTYEFKFVAVAPLTFCSPQVESIPDPEGVSFDVLSGGTDTGFTLHLTFTSSFTGESFTVPFTINTSQGPFDPSIVIDPPPPP